MTGQPRKILFYVQHLLGTGHLRRTAALARETAATGHDVLLVSGGLPVRGLDVGGARLHQLPPVRAEDSRFQRLVDAGGHTVDDPFKASRAEQLLQTVAEFAPDVMVIEQFPFGRRLMRFELLPLLDAIAARSKRPVVACSVRDILVAKNKPQRLQETADLIAARFDHVLVHADGSIVTLDRTFPLADRFAEKTVYTGYVCERDGPAPVPPEARSGVIVSAGGGAVGLSLLRAAVAAKAHSVLASATWRILVADIIAEEEFRALSARAGSGVIVERVRPDFRELMSHAAVSISQAGYNTMMDIVQTRTPAVVVPFADDTETEQTERAMCFADRGLVTLVAPDAMTPRTLAAAADRATAPDASRIDLNGARFTARFLSECRRRPT